MKLNDPISARAFIAECLVQGYEVKGLHKNMEPEEWVRVAILTWKELCEKNCGDKIIKFPARKKTVYSGRI